MELHARWRLHAFLMLLTREKNVKTPYVVETRQSVKITSERLKIARGALPPSDLLQSNIGNIGNC